METRGYLKVLADDVTGALWRRPNVLPRSVLPAWLTRSAVVYIALAIILAGVTFGMFAAAYFPVIDEHSRGPENSFVVLLVSLAQTLPLLLVWRAPLLAWRITAAGMFVQNFVALMHDAWPWSPGACIVYVVVLTVVALACDRRTVIAIGIVSVGGIVFPGAASVGMDPIIALLAVALVTVPLVVGDAVRARRTAERSLAVSEEERKSEATLRAVLEERARIARELHDIVAHHMSVIAVQAEAAPYRIKELPEPALETFTTIRGAAREALTETRRLVGLLREGGERAERAPQPDVDRIEDLVSEVRGTGMDVELKIIGTPSPLPTGMGLSVYRIVQESLSNVRRHAPGAPAVVEIEYGSSELDLRVVNGPGNGQGGLSDGRPGHGLLGMRERVAVYNGTLEAGTADDGGFVVKAWIPL
ncbi:sensor histidine kinase [Bailinhaonella thermotolerans]|uniref:histidine kinase n=2 Tax=Bailinhaonella thermotolerans TaxID=1070861 RepID=A0A3A4AC18_9ACTN|nr:sensor histidine kinase [Bailinhaonella thermotolerans]